MASSLTRTLRPVVLIGYGETGLAWLRRVASAGQGIPFIADLVKKGLIQFWAVASNETTLGDQWWTPQPDEHVDAIRAKLDRSRRDELRAQVPGLEPREVLVLERLSLFDAAGEHRRWLHEALSAARNLADDGARAVNAFELDWVTLADGTWPHGKPDRKQQELATRLCSSLTPRRTLFVDSQSAVRGVITPEVGDHVLGRIAVGMLSSDLAFPRRAAGSDGRSETFSNVAAPSAVTPVSILTLLHRQDDLTSLQVESTLRQLVAGNGGSLAQEALHHTYRQAVSLGSAVDADVAEGRAGGFRIGSKERRRQAIAAVFARALVELAPTDGQLSVKQLRDRIEYYRETNALRFSSSLPALQDRPDSTTGGGVLSFLRRFLYWLLRLLGGRTVSGIENTQHSNERLSPEINPSSLDDVLKQWAGTAERMDAILDCLRVAIHEGTHGRKPDQNAVWAHQDTPYDWRVSGLASAIVFSAPVTAELIEQLSRTLVEQVTTPGNSAREDALRVGIRSYINIRDVVKSSDFRDRQISAALQAPDDAHVRHAVQESPLLVSAGGHDRPVEIVWLTRDPEKHGELLCSLEQPQLRTNARALETEDPDRTLRLSLGADLPWEKIPSMSFLAKASN